MGSAAGLLGSLRLAAEAPAWERRGRQSGRSRRAQSCSAPTQALESVETHSGLKDGLCPRRWPFLTKQLVACAQLGQAYLGSICLGWAETSPAP